METLKTLLNLIKGFPFLGKILSTIIIILIVILSIFFSGCATKLHFDSIDNMTLEHTIDRR